MIKLYNGETYTVIKLYTGKRTNNVIKLYFWFKYDLGQRYQAPQVRPDQGSNSWPSDHDRHISCHWDACPNHSAISDSYRDTYTVIKVFLQENLLLIKLYIEKSYTEIKLYTGKPTL